jgi:CO/xanthine dehydrogenase FAD-binding subunit
MVDGFRPRDLGEALDILSRQACTVIAGGTDIMVQRQRGAGVLPDFRLPLLFIDHLGELQRIYRKDGEIRIGAAVRLSDMTEHPLIPPVLKTITGRIACPPTRHMATPGGNICNASPAGDTLPYLYAADAKLLLRSAGGERAVAVQDFITGVRRTQIREDELLTEIMIPQRRFTVNVYRKVGQRRGMSLSKLSFLGMADMRKDTLSSIRIALGAVAPVVVRDAAAEKMMEGKDRRELGEMRERILRRYGERIRPVDDARSTAAYRKHVALALTGDFLQQLCEKT